MPDLQIIDEIGYQTGTVKSVSDFLKNHKAQKVVVQINSPGGDVFEGIAIYNLLKSSPKTIHVEILGLAASAASLISMAGDTVSMAKSALFMIHNPWTFAGGDENDLQKTADRLKKIKTQMLGIYTGKTGLSEDEIESMLDDETWMSSEEAKAKGFIDKEMNSAGSVIYNSAGLDKFKYKKVPETITGNNAMNEKIKALLGVQDDEQVVQALQAKLDELKTANSTISTLEDKVEALENADDDSGKLKAMLAERDKKIATLNKAHEGTQRQLKAFAEERAKEAKSKVEAKIEDLKKRGYINAAMGESLLAMYDGHGQEAFDLQVETIEAGEPVKAYLTDPQGTDGDAPALNSDPVKAFDDAVQAAMKEDDSLDYEAASDHVTAKNPGLWEKYNAAVTSQPQ
jgi:ATP-dependent Clp endopeptidase proteolytic subunit ClpP